MTDESFLRNKNHVERSGSEILSHTPCKWPFALGVDLYVHGDETPQLHQHPEHKARNAYCIFSHFLSFPKNFTLLLKNPPSFIRGQRKNYRCHLPGLLEGL